jgi:D-serine deaminase-like pyridoxal phosphate-dependent protein
MTIDDLPTPSLLVERDRLLANIQAMAAKATAEGVALRPHVKTHRSAQIAEIQLAHGAYGITVATVSEAEVFVQAGFDDILIAYPVVGAHKLERLRALRQRGASVSICVDTHEGVELLARAFRSAAPLRVLLEVDTGQGRTGVPHDAPDLVPLAQAVAAAPSLSLGGVLTHGGFGYFGPQAGETKRAALERAAQQERDRLLDAAERLAAAGLVGEDFAVSLGSTPTLSAFVNAGRRAGAGALRVTEIRPGNYVFHDAMQVALGSARYPDCALTVLTTVVSHRRGSGGQERFYLDAGKKVLTSDGGYGLTGYGQLLYNARTMVALPHAEIVALSEEHAWARVRGGATVDVGDRLRLVPNHACTAVSTQDRLFLMDGDEVLEEIRVDARGCSV